MQIVTKFYVNDSPYMLPLLESEERVEEVYADKGYDSLRFKNGVGGYPLSHSASKLPLFKVLYSLFCMFFQGIQLTFFVWAQPCLCLYL